MTCVSLQSMFLVGPGWKPRQFLSRILLLPHWCSHVFILHHRDEGRDHWVVFSVEHLGSAPVGAPRPFEETRKEGRDWNAVEGPKADLGDSATVGSVLTLGAEFLVMWFSGQICFFVGL